MSKANTPRDGKLLAQKGDWKLFERFHYRDWRNFKLINESKGEKANYWFGFGQGRFSYHWDLRLLKEHNPEAYNWVVEIIESTEEGKENLANRIPL